MHLVMSNLYRLPLRGTERPVTEKVENPNTSLHERVRYIDLIRGKGEKKRKKNFRNQRIIGTHSVCVQYIMFHNTVMSNVPNYSSVAWTNDQVAELSKVCVNKRTAFLAARGAYTCAILIFACTEAVGTGSSKAGLELEREGRCDLSSQVITNQSQSLAGRDQSL